MNLYYTNISAEDQPQSRTDLSLGGFKSSSLVPNDSFANLFSDLSCYSVKENRDEYIGLILKNNTGSQVDDVTLYFTYPTDPQKTIEFAFVALNSNNEIEIIPTVYSKPLIGTFEGADGIGNAVNIGNLAADAAIGIWFKRIINISELETEYSDANLIANGTPQEANEDITLVIDYTTP